MRYLIAILALLASITTASAQGQAMHLQCLTNTTPPWANCSTTYPLPVSGSFSATTTGFPTVQTTGTPISVTTGGVTGTLPSGAVVVASNVGTTNAAYCKLGASATTSDQYIAPSGGWFAFTVGANTQLTCITSTSTTTVNMVGGSGLPTGTGGGSGGGGGGGAVTIADGADVAEGTSVDLASSPGSAGTVSSKLRLMTTQLGTINTTLGSPFQAGGSIGNTTFAVTNTGTFAVQAAQSGTWNITNVSGTISLPTGAATSALQTTGNTSLATIATNSALPLPAQTGIGNVNIGAVQSAGSNYETVAASQTGQALGATGATGDYLSHCVIYPVTTGAGAVTVFDNANAAATNVITFTSGTLSNLAPIALPVGAISTAGAWKVTTGANVTVTCYGKFT